MTAYFRMPALDKPVEQPQAPGAAGRSKQVQIWLMQTAAIMRATFSRKVCVTMALLAGLVVSALTVVYANQLNRSLFIDLQKEQKLRDHFQVEWTQLLLEQSAWSALSRVESLAAKDLEMKVPDPEDVVIVK